MISLFSNSTKAKFSSIIHGDWVWPTGRRLRREALDLVKATPSYFLHIPTEHDSVAWLPDSRGVHSSKSSMKVF